MSLTSKVIEKSVRKYPDNTYCGRVITTNSKDQEVTYFCRVLADGSFDSENVFFINGSKWKQITLTDDLLNVVKKPLLQVAADLSSAFTRKVTDKKGRKCLSMWDNAVITVSYSTNRGHVIKVGDRLFTTVDCMTLAQPGSKSMRCRYIGEASFEDHLYTLSSDKETTDILQKQFDIAHGKYKRSKGNKPVGFATWGQLQDSRKEFGQSTRNAKELDKTRGR